MLLTGGCFTSGIALLMDRFAAWMLVPIGVSYVAMVPLPCYFPWFTATSRRRVVRNAAFVAFAGILFALGFEVVPLSVVGL